MKLILYSEMLSQFENLILKDPVLLWVLMVPALSSYSLITHIIRVGWVFSSLLCIRAFW